MLRLTSQEIELGCGLIEKLSSEDFEPDAYENERRNRVTAMIDDTLRAWVPYASVSSYADSSKSYYYQLNKLKETFETEEEALAFGFSAARHWIDEHKAD